MIAIFLQNLEHANFVLKNKKFKKSNYIFFTNNLSVYCFLNDIKKVGCINLEEKITTQKNLQLFKTNYLKFLKTLKKFSEYDYFKNLFNSKDNLNWIFSLYKYKPLLEYIGFNIYSKFCTGMIKKKKIKKLIIFNDFPSNSFLDKNDFVKLNDHIAKKQKIKLEIYSSLNKKKNFQNINFIHFLKLFLKYIISKFNNLFFKTISRIKKTDLVGTLQPYYELKFIKLPKKYVVLNELDEVVEKFKYNFKKEKILSPINEKEIKDFKITSNDIVLNIVFDKILDHFEKNINFYRNYCLKIKKTLNINNITKIFWGMPPANPDLRLALISYLKANNIKTIGVQHGGCYGDQNYDSIQILTDYLNCNNFLSYEGFKVNFSKKLFKFDEISKVIKKGSFKKNFYNKNYYQDYKKNRILYVISHWNRSFIGFPSVTTSYMYKLQKQILFTLDKIKINDKVVKFSRSFSNIDDDSTYPGHILIQKFQNFKIESQKNLIASVNYYKPELIILDTYSTSMHELYNSKSEIVCFLDNGSKVKKNFRKLYSKRIHFVENINQFKNILKKFQSGKLKYKSK